jgi:hypothetical protein
MIDSSETPESLRERWKSGIWKDALDAILAEAARTTRSISAEFLESLELPRFEGRLDLRGVNFYEPLDPPTGGHDKMPFRLIGGEYKDVDFSHTCKNFYVSETKFNNCLFCHSTLESCWFYGCFVLNCSFIHASMSWFSASGRTHFVNSIFDYTRIRHDASIY